MNFLNPIKHRIERFRTRHASAAPLAAVILAIAGHAMPTGFAQEPIAEEPGAQVLTRGPVHEAFAGIISFDPLPGIVVTTAPPELIEEIPPGERPVGDDVTWIPGYWAWDDERNDFLWISGIWRALPPGREWIVGYWGETTEGYQWTSGYWADVATTETTYLPAPPKSVEEGPNIEAPSSGHGWTPGCWIWSQERYAWSPGYWAEGRSDWDWIPTHYVWTRRGYVFVGGYWDHSVERRGVLFAPVYFERSLYSRPGYSYSPTIVINLTMFTSHLFLRPRYDHYYFGDYYAPSYRDGGFYASFSYQSSRRGYDPFYAHQRWNHRDDRDWERGIERDYQYRIDEKSARPPHTWADQRRMEAGSPETRRNQSMLAVSLDQMSKREDSPTRFQPVAKDDRERLAQRGQEVQKSREQRRAIEGEDGGSPREGGKSAASKVPSARSPIAAKAGNEGKGSDRAPEPQRAPQPEQKPDSKALPGGRPAQEEKGRPQSPPREGENAPPKAMPQQEPGRPSPEDMGKGRKADTPPVPNIRPQQEPGRPSMEGKGRKPELPPVPNIKPQQVPPQQEPGSPSIEGMGKGRKADTPPVPNIRPQQAPPQQQEPGRPSMEGRGRAPEAPQVPNIRPQQAPPQQQEPGRPSMEGKGRAPEAPQVPNVRPQQAPPQQQPDRPAREGRSQRPAPQIPQAPQVIPQAAPSPPKADRPVTEDRGKGKREDEDPRGKKRN